MADYSYDTGTDKDVDPEGVAEFFACVESGRHAGVVTTLALYPNAVNWRRSSLTELDMDEDALYVACNMGRTHIAEILLDAKAPVESRNWGTIKATPLMAAVCCQSLETLKLLLARGASPLAVDADGTPPLALACELSRPDIAETLLKCGASPDTKNAKGTPVLAVAASFGNKEVIRLLLRYDASTRATDAAGRDVVEATRYSLHPETAPFIVQAAWEHHQELRDAFNREVDDAASGGTASRLTLRKPLKLKAGI